MSVRTTRTIVSSLSCSIKAFQSLPSTLVSLLISPRLDSPSDTYESSLSRFIEKLSIDSHLFVHPHRNYNSLIIDREADTLFRFIAMLNMRDLQEQLRF
jgi:hypothetical protein